MSGQNVCCPEMLSGHIYKVNSSTGMYIKLTFARSTL